MTAGDGSREADLRTPWGSIRIGIDLGGTKIEAIALAPDGTELDRRRVPTPRSYDGTLAAVAGLVTDVERHTGRSGSVGVGIPGAVSPGTDLVKNANSTWLIGRPLSQDLSRVLDRPVRLMNDANCFALSEATDGAGAGAPVVFGVILGTGVGGGLVVAGRCIEGPNRIAGEWGHNPLPWPTPDEVAGPACYCGLRGCIETYLSGPGMERDHEATTGEHLTTQSIARRSVEGDPAAQSTMERYRDRLARGLAAVVNVADPDVLVLGGGMSNLPDLAPSVEARLSRWVFSDEIRTRVVSNRHGDSSGVRGAAWLWPPTPGVSDAAPRSGP